VHGVWGVPEQLLLVGGAGGLGGEEQNVGRGACIGKRPGPFGPAEEGLQVGREHHVVGAEWGNSLVGGAGEEGLLHFGQGGGGISLQAEGAPDELAPEPRDLRRAVMEEEAGRRGSLLLRSVPLCKEARRRLQRGDRLGICERLRVSAEQLQRVAQLVEGILGKSANRKAGRFARLQQVGKGRVGAVEPVCGLREPGAVARPLVRHDGLEDRPEPRVRHCALPKLAQARLRPLRQQLGQKLRHGRVERPAAAVRIHHPQQRVQLARRGRIEKGFTAARFAGNARPQAVLLERLQALVPTGEDGQRGGGRAVLHPGPELAQDKGPFGLPIVAPNQAHGRGVGVGGADGPAVLEAFVLLQHRLGHGVDGAVRPVVRR
jgi:hypothetical protein